MFNNKLIKYNKFCYQCDEYYTGYYCDECKTKLYNIYNKSILTKHIVSAMIPKQFYIKLFLLATQFQEQYKILHIDKHLMSIIEFLSDEKKIMLIASMLITLLV
jgi:hypothetical protein